MVSRTKTEHAFIIDGWLNHCDKLLWNNHDCSGGNIREYNSISQPKLKLEYSKSNKISGINEKIIFDQFIHHVTF